MRELHEAAQRGCEPAGVDVERAQLLVEVHVQELTPRSSGAVASGADETDADTPVARLGGDHDVLEVGVHEAIPEDVHEADETRPVAGDDPPEAVALALLDPVPLRLVVQPSPERLSMHRVDLDVRELPAPRVRDDAAVGHDLL